MNRGTNVAVLVSFLLATVWVNAVVKQGVIRVKVLDSETRSVTFDDSGVPKNCDGVNFDAYCHNSKTSELVNTLVVQEGDQAPYRVSCASDAKWSRCMPLLKGVSYDARHDKRGLIVYYVDDIGKVRKQLYTFVAAGGDSAPAAATAQTSTAPSPPQIRPPAESGPVVAPGPSRNTPQESVKCTFSSTPAGAEVRVDGQYVGSTPSVLSLSVGKHAVEVSLPGFVDWKRDLAVATGSELTVNAVLEKRQ